MKKNKKEVVEENPIFQFKKYRVFAKYDTAKNDFIRLPDGKLDPTFDDYYLLTKTKDEVHHVENDIFLLYIWSLKRGNRLLEELPKNIVINYEKTDSEILIYFKAEHIDEIHDLVTFFTSGALTSPTDIKNLPGTYDIPEKRLEEFTLLGKELNIPISTYKKLYVAFIDSKTTVKNNALHSFEVSEIPAKEFIYHNGWWNDFLKYMKEYEY